MMTKDLSIDEAKRLIYKLINESTIETIENFWFIELEKCHLSQKDNVIYHRFLSMKNDKTEPQQSLYLSCIKSKILHNFAKKNWRRLFNNGSIERYQDYKKQLLLSENNIG